MLTTDQTETHSEIPLTLSVSTFLSSEIFSHMVADRQYHLAVPTHALGSFTFICVFKYVFACTKREAQS